MAATSSNVQPYALIRVEDQETRASLARDGGRGAVQSTQAMKCQVTIAQTAMKASFKPIFLPSS
jgi:hypothetical protein